jgi:glycerol-3-phosphate dehydrogenase
MDRRAALAALRSGETFDLLVIGGGATGCGVALDAASRGLKTALVERADFGEGTSSRSTKLVHGGVRYLELAIRRLDRAQFDLVRQALRERSLFLKNAPHLARPLPLVAPVYRWRDAPYLFAGLRLYDLLAGRQGLGRSRWLGRDETLRRCPMLKAEGLKGAVLFYDGQFDDARMAVTLALTAAEFGAAVASGVAVVGLEIKAGELAGVRVDDRETGDGWTIAARSVVNAAGSFADGVRRIADPQAPPLIRASSGVHIVVDRRFAPAAAGLMIRQAGMGRVLFILPWQGHALIGTTDDPAGVEAHPQPTAAAIASLLRQARPFLTAELTETDILSAWCGLRPLTGGAGADTARIPRDHLIEVGESGLLTVCGGKWTTYRKMAQDAVDATVAHFQLNPQSACRTADLPLAGAKHFDAEGGAAALAAAFGLDADIAAHLHQAYGDRARRVVECGPAVRLHPAHPFIEAEVIYGARFEAALTAMDVLARRLPLAMLDRQAARDAAARVIELLAAERGWDPCRRANEAAETERRLTGAI